MRRSSGVFIFMPQPTMLYNADAKSIACARARAATRRERHHGRTPLSKSAGLGNTHTQPSSVDPEPADPPHVGGTPRLQCVRQPRTAQRTQRVLSAALRGARGQQTHGRARARGPVRPCAARGAPKSTAKSKAHLRKARVCLLQHHVAAHCAEGHAHHVHQRVQHHLRPRVDRAACAARAGRVLARFLVFDFGRARRGRPGRGSRTVDVVLVRLGEAVQLHLLLLWRGRPRRLRRLLIRSRRRSSAARWTRSRAPALCHPHKCTTPPGPRRRSQR